MNTKEQTIKVIARRVFNSFRDGDTDHIEFYHKGIMVSGTMYSYQQWLGHMILSIVEHGDSGEVKKLTELLQLHRSTQVKTDKEYKHTYKQKARQCGSTSGRWQHTEPAWEEVERC